MFARISNRYDLLNTVMTAGRHLVWKKCVAELAATEMEGPALDVATGTGDIAISLSKISAFSKIIGLDFTREMLEIAKRKSQQPNLTERLNYIVGDAHALPFSNNQFVSATVGFGIRNFTDIPKALTEISRVLKPGGSFICTEALRHNPITHWYRSKTVNGKTWMGRTVYLRTKYEFEHILGVPEIMLGKKYFESVSIRFFHLFALGAVPFRKTFFFSFLLSLLEGLDNIVLRIPYIQRLAWVGVIEYKNPIQSDD